MEKFRIGFVYTEGGYVDVEEESAESAWEKLNNLLDEDGLNALDGAQEYSQQQNNEHGLSDYKTTHREWQQV